MRTRTLDAALALLATLAAVLGLTTLTVSGSWLAPTMWCGLAVSLAGALLRKVTSHDLLVLLGQALFGTWAVLLLTVPGGLENGLPGPWTIERVAALTNDVSQVVQKYSAPIPTTTGVIAMLVAITTFLVLVVDYLGVTRQAPAVAGLPLLAAFLTAVANSGSSLAPGYFLVAALAWLILVTRTTSTIVRRWSTTIAAPRTPTSTEDAEVGALSGLGSNARRLAVTGLVAAVVLPAVLPHLPTRFVLDGLGRNDQAVGGGSRVGFTSTLDLTRSLQSGSLNPVITYRTTAPGTPPPLRVVVAPTFADGQWRSGPADSPSRELTAASRLSPDVPVQARTVTVTGNALDAPHLAAPQPVSSVDVGDNAWSADADTGDLFVRSRPAEYSLTYQEVNVASSQLRAGIPGGDTGARDPLVSGSLGLDPGSAPEVTALAEKVAGVAATPWDAAVAIQTYLRGPDFTYSLTLPPPPRNDRGEVVIDPVVSFLTTRQGYCVQFATAMVMMARARGIPARMAIGFLPGTAENGVFTVRSADAHAWPELFFPGAGWLRFEPTPAQRTGTAPAYTRLADTPGGPTGGPQPSASATSTSQASVGALRKPDAPLAEDPVAATPIGVRLIGWLTSPAGLVVLAVLLGLLGSLVLPVTARLVHRRRRAHAADAAALAEAEWAELVSRLRDLGLHPPPGGTLREWRTHYVRHGYLDADADASIGRVVATVERTRYARPGPVTPDGQDDVEKVTHAVSQSRPTPQRLRAFFVPEAGVLWWRRSTASLTHAPERWGRRLADSLSRRG